MKSRKSILKDRRKRMWKIHKAPSQAFMPSSAAILKRRLPSGKMDTKKIRNSISKQFKRDDENILDARQTVRDSNRSRFTNDRRSYGMIRELDGAAFENSQAGRYEEQIHICHCCKTEWTDTDVRESGGRFVPGWITEKPTLSELDRSLIHHRVIEKLQSYRICHDCRARNETALTKKDYEPVIKNVCRKIWTNKQPTFRSQVDLQRTEEIEAARNSAERTNLEEMI